MLGLDPSALGELERPPRRCCGGTVTVIGAVMTGAEAGMGSDTEMTTLVGGALLATLCFCCCCCSGEADNCCCCCCGIICCMTAAGGIILGNPCCGCGGKGLLGRLTMGLGYMLPPGYIPGYPMGGGAALASCCCNICCCSNGCNNWLVVSPRLSSNNLSSLATSDALLLLLALLLAAVAAATAAAVLVAEALVLSAIFLRISRYLSSLMVKSLLISLISSWMFLTAGTRLSLSSARILLLDSTTLASSLVSPI